MADIENLSKKPPETLNDLKEQLEQDEGVTPELIRELGDEKEQKEVQTASEKLHGKTAPLVGGVLSNLITPIIKKPEGKNLVKLLHHCIDSSKKKPVKIPMKKVLSDVFELTTYFPKKTARLILKPLSSVVSKVDAKLGSQILNSPDILLEKVRKFYNK